MIPPEGYSNRMRSHHQALAPLFALRSGGKNFVRHLGSLSELSVDASRRRVIYIHVPFCTRSCTFCNLRRIQSVPPNDYKELIIREIKTYASSKYVGDGTYDAIYFGGGTPTTLPAQSFREILCTLRSYLTLSPDIEVTVETTASDLTKERIAVFEDEEVNRFSVGVQTFSSEGRRLLGRVGSGRHAKETVASLLENGFQNVGIDLIYNYPGQLEDDLNEDLSVIESLGIAGLSFYPLILTEGTPLHRMIGMGKCVPLGDLEQEWRYFGMILNRLLSRGFSLLELTKLVQPGIDNYEYIRVRYENGDTLAFGAGAGGRLGDILYMNPTSVDAYRQQVRSSTGLPSVGVTVDKRYDCAYRVLGRLQFGRLNWADMNFLPGGSQPLHGLTEKLAAMGLVRTDSGGFSLTRKGIFWGNNIGQQFAKVMVRSIAGQQLTTGIPLNA